MAYLLNSVDLYNTYEIRAGHTPRSNISLQGCFDMPKRIGVTYKDWGDSDSVEPWVAAGEIMFAGRDIVFSGSIQGTVSEINTNLQSFYDAINAATGISIFETPYNSASGYVKSVNPKHVNSGCTLEMVFREPVVALTGTLPASGSSAYTIDSIPFSSFGLYLSKAEQLHDLPEIKEQFVTKYGQEGYQIVKRKNKTLDMNGFVAGSSLGNFITNVQALYKVFSSSGTRSIVLNTITTVVCFATEGFKIENIHYSDTGVIAKFHISLMVKSVAYYETPPDYPACLDDGNTVAWFDAQENITKDGSNLVSAWGDKSGLAHHLLQATGSKQPLWSADGVLFDGIDNFMKCVAFTWVQPEFIYIVIKSLVWGINDRFFDGQVGSSGMVADFTSSPNISAYAGTHLGANAAPLNTYFILRVLFNGASSKVIINDETPLTWNCGANNMGGFTLGAISEGNQFFANIEVKEIILRKVGDAAGDEAAIYAYLATKYEI